MKPWQQLTNDPNSIAVVLDRQANLSAVRNPTLVEDRVLYFCALAKGKRVLDVGVVDHCIDAADSDNWLHGRLCRVASECHGVDVLPEQVAKLQQKGFSVSCINLVDGPIAQKFEVIICGEVLEHLDGTGRFLRNCRSMLPDEGLLVVSVPNPWYCNVFLKAAFGRHAYQDNVDHVAWYDASTIYELGQRCGFKLVKYSGVRVQGGKSLLAKLFFGLSRVWLTLGLRHEVLAKTMIYEFQAIPDAERS